MNWQALSNGDKILSENYYQYADHFLRISIEQKISKKINPTIQLKQFKILQLSQILKHQF